MNQFQKFNKKIKKRFDKMSSIKNTFLFIQFDPLSAGFNRFFVFIYDQNSFISFENNDWTLKISFCDFLYPFIQLAGFLLVHLPTSDCACRNCSSSYIRQLSQIQVFQNSGNSWIYKFKGTAVHVLLLDPIHLCIRLAFRQDVFQLGFWEGEQLFDC